MTADEVLHAVDHAFEGLDPQYRRLPDLYPFEGEPPAQFSDYSYTAYFAGFLVRLTATCRDHTDRLVVETLLVSPGRLTQEAYREKILPERDKVLDALAAIEVVGAPIAGSFLPRPDGLSIRTRFELPVTYERPIGA